MTRIKQHTNKIIMREEVERIRERRSDPKKKEKSDENGGILW